MWPLAIVLGALSGYGLYKAGSRSLGPYFGMWILSFLLAYILGFFFGFAIPPDFLATISIAGELVDIAITYLVLVLASMIGGISVACLETRIIPS